MRSLLVVVLLTAVGAVAPQASAYDESGCVRHTYAGPEGSRDYLLCTPRRLGRDRALVVYLPGAGQSADQAAIDTRWPEVGTRLGFVTLVPEASTEEGGYFHYSEAAHQHRGTGVPGIVAGMTRRALRDLRLDRRHVYVGGTSNGGAMSNTMLATYPDLYAAVFSHSGAAYQCSGGAFIGCPTPDGPDSGDAMHREMGRRAKVVPFLVFQGAADSVVPPAEADRVVVSWLRANDLADDGKANRSVPAAPRRTVRGAVRDGHSYTVRHYVDGRGCRLGEYWLVDDMRHAYSGGRPSALPGMGVDPSSPRPVSASATDPAGPDATGIALRFFAASGPRERCR